MSTSTPEEIQEEFTLEHMHVKMSKKPGCRISLLVTVDPIAVKAAYQKGIKAVRKEVSLPGFRKGHAPDHIILKNYASSIQSEWRQALLETAYHQCLDKVKLYPVDSQTLKPKVVDIKDENNPVTLSFEYESYPTVPTIDLKNIQLSPPAKETVTEESINGVIDQIRHHFAIWEEVKDRAAVENDWVSVDVQRVGENKGYVLQKERIKLDSSISQWLKDLIIGKKAGEEAEGENALDPKADEDAKKHFQKDHFLVTLHSIDTPTLPEIDDELAKKVGTEDVTQLRTSVTKKLENEANEARHESLSRQVEDLLLQNYSFDLPNFVLQKEIDYRVKKMRQQFEQKGASVPDTATLTSEATLKSQQTLQLFYLAKEFAKEHKLEVSMHEFYATLAKMMNLSQQQIQMVMNKPDTIPQELTGAIYSQALLSKVLSYIIEQRAA